MADSRYTMLEAPRRFAIGHRTRTKHRTRAEVRVRVHARRRLRLRPEDVGRDTRSLPPPLLIGPRGLRRRRAARRHGGRAADGSSIVVFPPVAAARAFHCGSGRPALRRHALCRRPDPDGLAEHLVVPSENTLDGSGGRSPSAERVLISRCTVGVHARRPGGRRAAASRRGPRRRGDRPGTALVARTERRRAGLARRAVRCPARAAPRRLGLETFDTATTSLAEGDRRTRSARRARRRLRVRRLRGDDRRHTCLDPEQRPPVLVGDAPPDCADRQSRAPRGDRSLVGVPHVTAATSWRRHRDAGTRAAHGSSRGGTRAAVHARQGRRCRSRARRRDPMARFAGSRAAVNEPHGTRFGVR